MTPPIKSTYLVCATPRSGTTLLGELLSNTGIAGHPEEYFGRANEWAWLHGLDPTKPQEYLAAVKSAGTSPSGIHGEKLFWPSFVDMTTRVARAHPELPQSRAVLHRRVLAKSRLDDASTAVYWWARRRWPDHRLVRGGFKEVRDTLSSVRKERTDAASVAYSGHDPHLTHSLLSAVFPNLHYVFLTREDKVAQAVSFARAAQTGMWRSYSTPFGGPDSSGSRATFDVDLIRSEIARMAEHETSWISYFDEIALQPHRITYEELVADPPASVRRVLAYIGVDRPESVSIAQERLRRQADSLSGTWIRDFNETVQKEK